MTLRPCSPGDLFDLVDLHNDSEVMHFINNGAAVSASEVAKDLSAWTESTSWQGGDDFGFLAAAESATGRFLGWFHLRHRDGLVGPELGFRLCRSEWGKGLASEGAIALIDRGFTDLPIGRIFAHTMVIHWRSRRVLEKAGLRVVRIFETDWPVAIPGDEHGDVEYAITRAEWSTAASHSVSR